MRANGSGRFRLEIKFVQAVLMVLSLLDEQNAVSPGVPANGKVGGNIAGMIAMGFEKSRGFGRLAVLWFVAQPTGIDDGTLAISFAIGIGNDRLWGRLSCGPVWVAGCRENQAAINGIPQWRTGRQYIAGWLKYLL
jgi:hypothetical protein